MRWELIWSGSKQLLWDWSSRADNLGNPITGTGGLHLFCPLLSPHPSVRSSSRDLALKKCLIFKKKIFWSDPITAYLPCEDRWVRVLVRTGWDLYRRHVAHAGVTCNWRKPWAGDRLWPLWVAGFAVCCKVSAQAKTKSDCWRENLCTSCLESLPGLWIEWWKCQTKVEPLEDSEVSSGAGAAFHHPQFLMIPKGCRRHVLQPT